MERYATLPRRRVLGGLAGALVTVSLSGCTGDDGNGDDTGPDDGSGGSPDDESPAGDSENGGADSADGDGAGGENGNGNDTGSGDGDGELDLREANVVGVSFEAEGGSYGFDVTLHHDDDGEDGYANWWQVERLDGSQLGRRELLHAHSQQPFTRSETIEIPDDVSCVVVRGHDQTHEYGGQAMLVNVDSGGTQAIDQGPERQSVEDSDCP